MSDAATRFHEDWLGRVQPLEGLVVSIPILVDAQCDLRQKAEFHNRFVELVSPPAVLQQSKPGRGKSKRPAITEGPLFIRDLDAFLAEVLELSSEYFHRDVIVPLGGPRGEIISRHGFADVEIPGDLHYYAPEGRQDVRPTLALCRQEDDAELPAETSAAARAAAPYVALLWDLPEGLELDKPETETGPWRYPPIQKFIRLLLPWRTCSAASRPRPSATPPRPSTKLYAATTTTSTVGC